jgi:CRP/FNR family cyclic AMP-dependent transcriptional regulator
MSLIDLLKTVSLFNGLSDHQLQRLIDISAEEIFDDEDIIIEQGAEGDKLYFISEGQVEILVRRRPTEPNRSQVYLGRGQIFGEMALIDMGKRSATVRCSQDHTVLRVVDSEDFSDLCGSDTAIGYIIMRNMAIDLSFKLRHRNLDLGADSL